MTRLVRLILTDDLRGKGDSTNPMRRVKQLWTPDGLLVAEADPWNGVDGFADGPSFFRPHGTELDR